jgi:hypothetical protein
VADIISAGTIGARDAGPTRACRVGQPQRSNHNPGETDTEFLQRATACDRLGHALGEFIEFVLHNNLFLCLFPFLLPEIDFRITKMFGSCGGLGARF